MKPSNCVICKKDKELRLGFCFNCMNAQAIIGTDEDCYSTNENVYAELSAKEATRRLKMLIKEGWVNNEAD